MKRTLVCIALLSCLSAPAFGQRRFELGIGAGYPTALAMVLGFWGGSGFPIVVRASAGLGAQLDLGVELDPESPIKKYLAVSGGAVGFFGVGSRTYTTAGLSAGLQFQKFFVQAGPCLHFGDSDAKYGVQGMIGISTFF